MEQQQRTGPTYTQIKMDAKRAISVFACSLPPPVVDGLADAFASVLAPSTKPPLASTNARAALTRRRSLKVKPPRVVLRKCDSEEFSLTSPQFSKAGRGASGPAAVATTRPALPEPSTWSFSMRR